MSETVAVSRADLGAVLGELRYLRGHLAGRESKLRGAALQFRGVNVAAIPSLVKQRKDVNALIERLEAAKAKEVECTGTGRT